MDSMDRLLFTFKVLATVEEPKMNVICITNIGTQNSQNYLVPDQFLNIQHHTEVKKTSAFMKVKKTLTKRNQTRKVWIVLTQELIKTYIDDGGNLHFDDVYLEEASSTQESTGIVNAPEQPLTQLLEKLLEKKLERHEEKNIGKIAAEFTIEKFNGKNSNVNQWITSFEKECERFNVTRDDKKIELLKSFMEKCAIDWYGCTLLKLTIEANWEDWKNSFCETFANKGWSSIRYALQFKYRIGSLLEYAIKKEKLLLEARKSIDNGTLIDLIAIGLPSFIVDRIDREKLKKTEDLYNEIGKLEHLVHKKNVDTKKNNRKNSKKLLSSV